MMSTLDEIKNMTTEQVSNEIMRLELIKAEKIKEFLQQNLSQISQNEAEPVLNAINDNFLTVKITYRSN